MCPIVISQACCKKSFLEVRAKPLLQGPLPGPLLLLPMAHTGQGAFPSGFTVIL